MGPDDALLVRGRVRADLERFADFAAERGARPALVESPEFDYGFRLKTSRDVLAAFVAERVATLDYPNFKSEIYKTDPVLRTSTWACGRRWASCGGVRG